MKTKDKKDATQISRRRMLAETASGTAAVVGTTLIGSLIGSTIVGCDDDAPPIPNQEPPDGPVQWAMFLDLSKCTGCKACAVACKMQNEVPLGTWRREVKELEIGTYPNTERRYLPWLCNHCKNPPCVSRCQGEEICASMSFADGTELAYMKKATYRRPDGVVLVDQDRCIGCGNCIEDCPYGARFSNVDIPAIASDNPLAGEFATGKCNYCVKRTEGGVVPACVQTCPANALIFGDAADPNSDVSIAIAASSDATGLLTSYQTDPATIYAGYAQADLDDIFVSGKDTKDEKCGEETDDSCRSTS